LGAERTRRERAHEENAGWKLREMKTDGQKGYARAKTPSAKEAYPRGLIKGTPQGADHGNSRRKKGMN